MAQFCSQQYFIRIKNCFFVPVELSNELNKLHYCWFVQIGHIHISNGTGKKLEEKHLRIVRVGTGGYKALVTCWWPTPG